MHGFCAPENGASDWLRIDLNDCALVIVPRIFMFPCGYAVPCSFFHLSSLAVQITGQCMQCQMLAVLVVCSAKHVRNKPCKTHGLCFMLHPCRGRALAVLCRDESNTTISVTVSFYCTVFIPHWSHSIHCRCIQSISVSSILCMVRPCLSRCIQPCQRGGEPKLGWWRSARVVCMGVLPSHDTLHQIPGNPVFIPAYTLRLP